MRGFPAWDRILAALPAGALLLFDLGYTCFAGYPRTGVAQPIAARVTFVTCAKGNLPYQVDHALRRTSAPHDEVVWVGGGADRQWLWLIGVLHRGTWHRYLTNETDPERLPVLYAVPLSYQRWRMEDAYALGKRLLGLASWGGAENAVQLQTYATWILYAVLLDLSDDVAAVLDQSLAAISIELLYRHLYGPLSVMLCVAATHRRSMDLRWGQSPFAYRIFPCLGEGTMLGRSASAMIAARAAASDSTAN